MAGMMGHAGQPLDQLRHPRQGPQIGAEALRPRARPQRPLDLRQLRAAQLGLAPGPPRRFQPRPSLGLPRLMPMIGRRCRDAQDPRDRSLRLAPREQLRGLEPPSFQRSKIPSGPAADGGHVPA